MKKNIGLNTRILFAALALILAFSINVTAQQKATYQVKQGDTLYGISKKLDVTIAELKQWNSISGNEIALGQELVYYISEEEETLTDELPEEPSDPLISQSSSSKNVFYTVKSGDTLYKIASDHDMSLSQLKSLNNLTSNTIRVGQKLAVRKTSEAPPSVSRFTEKSSPQGVFSVYEIKQGDSIYNLLSRFKMGEEEFSLLNPEIDLDNIVSGQKVTVLLPPSKQYSNPYLQAANLSDLGKVHAIRYDDSEIGETTTNGELYDPEALTAAHSNIALGKIIFIENKETGNGVYVRVNDRITSSGLKVSEKAFNTLRLNQSAQPAVTIYTEEND